MRDQPLRGLGANRLWALVAVLAVPPLAVISVTVAHGAESIGQAAAEVQAIRDALGSEPVGMERIAFT